MRLIDADALEVGIEYTIPEEYKGKDIELSRAYCKGISFANGYDARKIVNAQTINAVEVVQVIEVVRCKDCVHCSENGGEDCPVEKHHPIQMYGFCHFGERRSE